MNISAARGMAAAATATRRIAFVADGKLRLRWTDGCPQAMTLVRVWRGVEEGVDYDGIPKSKVQNAKVWLRMLGLLGPGRMNTEFGRLVREIDPFFEEPMTRAVMHFNLVQSDTLWGRFFRFPERHVERGIFINSIPESSDTDSVERDFPLVINTYAPKTAQNPEYGGALPFVPLKLLKRDYSRNCYIKTPMRLDILGQWGCSALLKPLGEKASLREIERRIAFAFNLGHKGIIDFINAAESAGQAKLVREGFTDVVRIDQSLGFIKCLENGYREGL